MNNFKKINYNRYKIVSLLYLVFITISILSIEISDLDSNYHVIKTFQLLQNQESKNIYICNKILEEKDSILKSNPVAESYIKIGIRLEKSIKVINQILNTLNIELEKQNSNVIDQFRKNRLLGRFYKSDTGYLLLEKDIFGLSDFIKNSNFKISSSLDSIIPIQRELKDMKGKSTSLGKYLFKNKTFGTGLMHLERIKLLEMKLLLLYKEATLHEIGYDITYYSNSDTVKYVLKQNEFEYFKSLKSANGDLIDSNLFLKQKNEQLKDSAQLSLMFKEIINSLQTENVFVGIDNRILNSLNYVKGVDFEFVITPNQEIKFNDDAYFVKFDKIGTYQIRFYDVKNQNKLLFEKNIMVNQLPDPIVKLKGDNLFKFEITKEEILFANRLEAKLSINNLNYFPGRINSFKVTRLHEGKQVEYVNNSGELFSLNTQKLISNATQSDILIFDNLILYLVDGSSRIANPIVLKIK